jgi:epoxyqueuosine reductase QueG
MLFIDLKWWFITGLVYTVDQGGEEMVEGTVKEKTILDDLITDKYITFYGVAAADAFEQFENAPDPRKYLPGAKSVIVFGMPYTRAQFQTVLDPELRPGFRPVDKAEYQQMKAEERHFFQPEYDLIKGRLKYLGYQIAIQLEEMGYAALPNLGSNQSTRERRSDFSICHAVYLAGLGSFGRNGLILHPRYGPRIRTNVVATSLELPPGEPMEDMLALCTDCGECYNVCPSGAQTYKGKIDAHR